MSESEDKKLMQDHNYDGIQELDNPLPLWWLFTFFATFIFSFFYVVGYHVLDGQSPLAEYESEWQSLQTTLKKNRNSNEPSAEMLLALMKDAGQLQKGHETFTAKCAACHGPEGQGIVGPNLTDEYWIHGQGKIMDIMTTVQNGVPEKGMIAWGPLLSKDEMQQVVAYVATLRGTHPANPKAPQGEKYEGVADQ